MLIGYLLVRGALNSAGEKWADSPGKGWDIMLSQICDREARTHENVDSQTVRHIVEKLASLARGKGGLTAPLAVTDMSSAFQSAVGMPPDERAETLLMRLPGVGAYDGEGHERRSFIDQEFASAAAAGDVWRYIQNPFDPTLRELVDVKEVLPATGIDVVTARALEEGLPSERVYVAFRRAIEHGGGELPKYYLSTDIFKVILTGEISPPREALRATIKSILLDELDLTSVPNQVGEVIFQDSLIVNLYISSDAKDDNDLPGFLRTEFNHIEGRTGTGDLPANKFIGCGFGTFSESFTTNASVIDLSVEPGLKALVTVLRKLFIQKGAGRKENAFYRGVPGVSSGYITEALRLVEGAAFAAKSKRGSGDPIWTPNRRMSARVNAILVAPARSAESIVIAAKQIKH